jgi:hypothetical protein
VGIEITLRLTSVEQYLRAKHRGARTLSATEKKILGTYADDIVRDIEDAWPVDTSTSRDAFYYTLDGGPPEITITIVNEVDYAEYVHYAGTDPEPPLYETLIPAVWGSYRVALAEELKRAIDVTEEMIRTSGLSKNQILSGVRPTRVPGQSRFRIPAAPAARRN